MHDARKDVLKTFAETTSVKGVSRVIKAQNVITQTFWCLAVVACFTGLVYSVANQYIAYCNFDVSSSTKTKFMAPSFPDITVCNLNPYADFQAFPISYDNYSKILNAMMSDERGVRGTGRSLPDISDVVNFLRSQHSYVINNRWKSIDPHDVGSFVVDYNFYTWDTLPIMHDTSADILVKWDPVYFRCYTFNAPDNKVARMTAVFYIDNFPEQIENCFTTDTLQETPSPGVLVTIQPGDTPADQNKDGVVVSPGTELTIRLDQTTINRKDNPVQNCMSCVEDAVNCHNTMEVCFSKCRQNVYIERCGCLASYEVFTDEQLVAAGNVFCSNLSLTASATSPSGYVGDPTRAACEYNTSPKNKDCACNWPCIQTTNARKSTTSQWPHKPYQLKFYKNYIRSNIGRYGGKFDAYEPILAAFEKANQSDVVSLRQLDNLTLIEDNFIHLTVFFPQMKVTTTTQQLTITWHQIVSSVGGALNFWAGISIVFVAELVELVYYLATSRRQARTEGVVELLERKKAEEERVKKELEKKSLKELRAQVKVYHR